ncbi:acyl-CoA dehydrogenase family protein [Pseudonocardia sp. KRD291]|uniref:acyl-CoA dehydrogenase family protein n=1 Tax=Pseudonocardia sp. KRD291 TaxID=2792007 RepID=UPI001C4A4D73|nr:acyl-CoA dehydrogenase family protein [Pseudonocardia sp. KRD291]MBW0100956.1 acyl-CoA dehydrogenase family protein [Pseudonocardia sp. KRD291]
MRWELSPEQADFRTVLADWLGDVCPRDTLRGWLDAGDHATFAHRLHTDGWFGVGAPEDLGGEGGGLVELALAAEQFGRHAAPSSSWLASMVALPAVAAVPDAAKALFGDGAVVALATPAGTIPGGDATVRAAGAGLSGSVPTVLAADVAARFVVPVRGEKGLELHLVDAGRPGVRVQPRALTDRSRSVADIELDGVPSTLIQADAAEVLARCAHRGAVLVAADALGAMVAMLDATVEYVGQRKQFGVPIGSFQAVKHAAAEMLVKVESSRSIAYLAAAVVDAGRDDAAVYAATAKAQICAAGPVAADSALTLHGAIGYTWEHDLQFFYKRALLDAELLGSPGAWNDVLADRLPLVPGPEMSSKGGAAARAIGCDPS